eukprot:CAMPEP_0171366430 /NCGR_PEP_ID=MMETSP0879-20121228/5382_1 /TAXON_ID=67004 /ORGANISM="Thalassiosira weissflogii, Strain CCMP1336" /LENGTH=191 /DNA_ID=CAMNT_0011874241 /DNA_START=843 /DNA_END=1418 /DNA_ORIENTATION=-
MRQVKTNPSMCINQQTKVDLHIAHSKLLTQVFDGAAPISNEIRRDLTVLDIQNCQPKKKFSDVEKENGVKSAADIAPNHRFCPKAGKTQFQVIVGGITHLYSSPKQWLHRKLRLREKKNRFVDLHGFSVNDAMLKLDELLPKWENNAMIGDYPWTTSVTIICGLGSQTLSEAVKGWISKKEEVAMMPKGFV